MEKQAEAQEEQLPYKHFYSGSFFSLTQPSRRGGRYWEAMGTLLKEGFQPASVSDVVRSVVEANNSDDPLVLKGLRTRNDCIFKHGTFYNKDADINSLDRDTADVVLFSPSSLRLKVAPNSRILRALSSGDRAELYGVSKANGERKNGPFDYSLSRGIVLKYDELEKAGMNRHLPLERAVSHPLWMALVKDVYLLNEYTKIRFSKAREKGEENAMGVFTPDPLDKSTTHFVHVSGSSYNGALALKNWFFYWDNYNLLGIPKKNNKKTKT